AISPGALARPHDRGRGKIGRRDDRTGASKLLGHHSGPGADLKQRPAGQVQAQNLTSGLKLAFDQVMVQFPALARSRDFKLGIAVLLVESLLPLPRRAPFPIAHAAHQEPIPRYLWVDPSPTKCLTPSEERRKTGASKSCLRRIVTLSPARLFSKNLASTRKR